MMGSLLISYVEHKKYIKLAPKHYEPWSAWILEYTASKLEPLPEAKTAIFNLIYPDFVEFHYNIILTFQAL